MNNIYYNFKWRGVKQLLATFLCLGLLAVSCKKKDNLVGASVLPDGTILSSASLDTFTIETYTVEEDSVPSTNPAYNILGSYIDPVFGTVDASFYTQLSLSNTSPVFGPSAKIDSMVFSMVYVGFYGELDDQTVEIFQLSEDLEDDKTYYPFNILNTTPTDLVAPNMGTFTPKPRDQVVVDGDSVLPQLRIHMDTNFARSLIDEAQTGSAFSSETNFKNYLKGLHVKVNNPTQIQGEGGVLYFSNNDAASKITIYYQELVNGSYEQFSYDLLINPVETDFNQFLVEDAGTPVENVINNPEEGMYEYYAQALKSRAKIEFPYLNDIPKDAVIQEAVLTIPVSHFTGDFLYPSNTISLTRTQSENSDDLFLVVQELTYSDISKAYRIDLRPYIQRIITGEIENTGLFLSPTFFNSSAERIVFNGPLSSAKSKPKLNILITDN